MAEDQRKRHRSLTTFPGGALRSNTSPLTGQINNTILHSDDIEPMQSPITEGSRPYRSHRYPACGHCRRRRTRCIRDAHDKPCRYCKRHSLDCNVEPFSGHKDASRRIQHREKRAQQAEQIQPGHTQPEAIGEASRLAVIDLDDANIGREMSTGASQRHDESTPSENDDASYRPTAPTHSAHIIGPVAARDIQVVEQYMPPSATLPFSHARPNPYSVYSSNSRNPIVYLKVPRRRVRAPRGNGSAGFKQYEAIEKALEPLGTDVVNLYFDAFHPAFPILDEKTVLESYKRKILPHVLVCEIYAVSIVSWLTSEKLTKARPERPDVRYIWNQTVEALNEEFLAPGLTTIVSCVLDLTGRPTTSMTYNAVNIGRAVALSHSLGLNRDPSGWNLDQRQKAMRVRTWWGVLIQDWWASLAHGTPPHIHPAQFDVEVPEIASLLTGAISANDGDSRISHKRIIGAQSFRALCNLTEILGDILPLVYNTKRVPTGNPIRSLRRAEAALDDWAENLPTFLNGETADFQRDLPGALNLQCSYLAVKMYISRISLLDSINSDDDNNPETFQYLLLQCRKAARAVIDFTISLRENDLYAFWLPYTAYHFAAAANLTLRCGLEASNEDITRECTSAAQSFVEYLRRAKDESNWDLADACLNQCESVVHQLSEKMQLSQQRRQIGQVGVVGSRSQRRRTDNRSARPVSNDIQTEQRADGETAGPSGSTAEHLAPNNYASMPMPGDRGAVLDTGGGIVDSEWDPFGEMNIPDPWDSDLYEYREFST